MQSNVNSTRNIISQIIHTFSKMALNYCIAQISSIAFQQYMFLGKQLRKTCPYVKKHIFEKSLLLSIHYTRCTVQMFEQSYQNHFFCRKWSLGIILRSLTGSWVIVTCIKCPGSIHDPFFLLVILIQSLTFPPSQSV